MTQQQENYSIDPRAKEAYASFKEMREKTISKHNEEVFFNKFDNETTGRKLASLRIKYGITQKELAIKTGLGSNGYHVCKYETDRVYVDKETFFKLLRGIGASIEEFVEIEPALYASHTKREDIDPSRIVSKANPSNEKTNGKTRVVTVPATSLSNYNALGKRINELRIPLNLAQYDIDNMMGKPKGWTHCIGSKLRNTRMTRDELELLAAILKTNPDKLKGGMKLKDSKGNRKRRRKGTSNQSKGSIHRKPEHTALSGSCGEQLYGVLSGDNILQETVSSSYDTTFQLFKRSRQGDKVQSHMDLIKLGAAIVPVKEIVSYIVSDQ